MPPVRLAVPDRGHDARRFACFKDGHDCIGARAFEVWVDEVVAAAMRGVQNRNPSLLYPTLQPVLELIGNATQRVPAHRIELPIRVEEANDALWLLERLNQPIQQVPIKATKQRERRAHLFPLLFTNSFKLATSVWKMPAMLRG